jgi:phage I-like protein
MKLFYVSKFEYKLSEKTSDIEVLRVGRWDHPKYGSFEVTLNELNGFIKSFEDNVRGIQIAFDLEHGETSHGTEAVAWVKKLSKDGNRLLATVEWTELGLSKVAKGQYRYFSPEFVFKYEDPETGQTYNNVLMGGSLTNKPFIKRMAPILLSEEVYSETLSDIGVTSISTKKKEEQSMNKELLKALKLSENASQADIDGAIKKQLEEAKKLSESITSLNKKIEDLEKGATSKEDEIKALKEDKDKAANENIKLADRIVTIEKQLLEEEWKKLSEDKIAAGKMTPAMAEKFKASFMKDKEGTKALMETLQPIVKLDEQGSAHGEGEVNTSQAGTKLHDKVIKLMETEKITDFNVAMQRIVASEPELYNQYRLERRGK